MVVHAEVDERVREARIALLGPDDEQCRGLLAAAVSACRLRGVETGEEPLGEGLSGRRLERLGERLDRLRRDEDVALRRVARTRTTAGPRAALLARIGRRIAEPVDDPDLTLRALLVRSRQLLDRGSGPGAVAQKREPLRPIARIRPGLGCDGADERLGPRDD
jgi:hypothetical protein